MSSPTASDSYSTGRQKEGGSERKESHTSENFSEASESEAPEEGRTVRKANRLIRSRIDWTPLQHRATAILISQLNLEEQAFEMQRLNIEQLAPPGSQEGFQDRLGDVRDQLLEQTVHTGHHDEDGQREYQGYNCFSTCRCDAASGDIEVKFDSGMGPFLFGDGPSRTYRLEEFKQLTSHYSMRIYELIKMEETSGRFALSVKEFCSLIGRKAIYDSLGELKAKVLDPSQAELKKRCHTYYTYVLERDDRARRNIRFTIHHRGGV